MHDVFYFFRKSFNYWRRLLCRGSQPVPAFAEYFLFDAQQRCYLPSAIEKALGKQIALGKDQVCRVSGTRQTRILGKVVICRVSFFDTRQTIFFFTFDLQTFSAVLIQYLVLHVPMWHISRTFFYISLIYIISLNFLG